MPYTDDDARQAARERLARRQGQRNESTRRARSDASARSSRSSRSSGSSRSSQPQNSRSRQGSASRRSASGQGGGRSSSGRGSSDRRQATRSQVDAPRRGAASNTPAGAPFGLPVSPVVLIAAAAVAVLLIILVVNIVRCSAPAPSQDQASANSQTTSATASAESTQSSSSTSSSTSSSSSSSSTASSSSSSSSSSASSSTTSNGAAAPEKLAELIGKDETNKLLERARTDTQALWIAAHPDDFAIDGEEVQVKILKLAADEPAAIPYVRSFPSEYPLKKFVDDDSIAMPADSPSADVPSTKVPHFYQWDRRWGNITYSSAAFGLTGCGPTSMAMVYQGITGKTDINPAQMAELAEERGYMSEYNGTSNTFFGEIAGELGITYEEESPSAAALTEALSAGKVVIARLGPGLFTERGHFFVLAGLADNGEVILNDPYSYERSSQTWPAETIADEATIFYVYSAA